MTKKRLSESEKQEAFKAREVQEKRVNRVLRDCMELMQASPLGTDLLAGANFKDVIGEEAYTSARDNHIFAVEKIYAGFPGRVKGGHCGFISAIDGDKTYENARGEIYLNAKFIHDTADALGEKRAAIYLSNLVAHEFTHGNQRTHIENKPENSRSRRTPEIPHNSAKKKIQVEDPKKAEAGWARMMLTEAAAMAAGITVMCSLNPDKKTKDYLIEDFEKLGHISEDKLLELKHLVDKASPKTYEGRQEASRRLMKLLSEGQQEYFSGKEPPVRVDFNKHLEIVKTVYQKELFGSPEDFAVSIPGLTEKSRDNLEKALKSSEKPAEKEGLEHNDPKQQERLRKEADKARIKKEFSNPKNQKAAVKIVEKMDAPVKKKEIAKIKMMIASGKKGR